MPVNRRSELDGDQVWMADGVANQTDDLELADLAFDIRTQLLESDGVRHPDLGCSVESMRRSWPSYSESAAVCRR